MSHLLLVVVGRVGGGWIHSFLSFINFIIHDLFRLFCFHLPCLVFLIAYWNIALKSKFLQLPDYKCVKKTFISIQLVST